VTTKGDRYLFVSEKVQNCPFYVRAQFIEPADNCVSHEIGSAVFPKGKERAQIKSVPTMAGRFVGTVLTVQNWLVGRPLG